MAKPVVGQPAPNFGGGQPANPDFSQMPIEEAVIRLFMLISDDARKETAEMLGEMGRTRLKRAAMRDAEQLMRDEKSRLARDLGDEYDIETATQIILARAAVEGTGELRNLLAEIEQINQRKQAGRSKSVLPIALGVLGLLAIGAIIIGAVVLPKVNWNALTGGEDDPTQAPIVSGTDAPTEEPLDNPPTEPESQIIGGETGGQGDQPVNPAGADPCLPSHGGMASYEPNYCNCNGTVSTIIFCADQTRFETVNAGQACQPDPTVCQPPASGGGQPSECQLTFEMCQQQGYDSVDPATCTCVWKP